MSKILVVDTNIFRGASPPYEDGTNPKLPNHCRKILEAILDICHKVAFTDQSDVEWQKHVKNPYTFLWMGNMRRRDKVKRLDNHSKDFSNLLLNVKENIDLTRFTPIEKDAFLFDLALASDKIILSKDRKLFNNVTHYPHLFTGVLQEINYAVINEDEIAQQEVMEWLENECSEPRYLIF